MEICGDNRFEIIAKAKADLLEGTNIETDEAEMAVIDNILFRCWQMGWLDRYDTADRKTEPTISKMEQVDKDGAYFLELMGAVARGEISDAGANQAWYEYINHKDEPQTETEIAKAIVHKMIDDAVIAEDAYPDLRQKMHDAVDEYEPQTDCSWK